VSVICEVAVGIEGALDTMRAAAKDLAKALKEVRVCTVPRRFSAAAVCAQAQVQQAA
jgi:hypothetical protein